MTLSELLIAGIPRPFHDLRRIHNLAGSASALLLAVCPMPFVAVEKDEYHAARLKRDIDFYRSVTGGSPVIHLPEPDGPEATGVRARLFASLTDRDSLVTPENNLITTLPADGPGAMTSMPVSRGCTIGRTSLENGLQGLGYRKTELVSAPGEYSRREWIFDVFPSTAEKPVRIEFFGDEVETLRQFDVETQRSGDDLSDIELFTAAEGEESIRLCELLTEHRWFCFSLPDDRDLLPPDVTVLSRFSFSGDDEEVSDGQPKSTDAGMLALNGTGVLAEERTGPDELPAALSRLSAENRILIVASSDGQAERLQDIFRAADMVLPRIGMDELGGYEGMLSVTVARLSSGLFIPGLVVLTEREIFGRRAEFRPLRKSRVGKLLISLEDIVPGDFVVHREHGIGKFSGIVRRHDEGTEAELMQIDYQDGRIYIPIQNIQNITKYRSEEGIVPSIDRLGGRTWQKKKERVRKRVNELAERLVSLYATRKVARGFRFSADTDLHREFDSFFPYEETPDQVAAISAIKRSMESEQPMDLLLCGDVGYGKTEVAMRAAFKAVFDARQVAVLVPTTILAEQHYRTFRERFSGFPVSIDYISRFKTRPEIKATLKRLEDGEIDILIGTHGVLAKSVRFARLGLLIVDEEHKFGVGQKERIKELSRDVDVLTLTATPIPRTLHMSLSGIREISLIETPPEDRLAVRSSVVTFDDRVIRQAVRDELGRDGQVYFVHNRIQDIYRVAERILGLVPESKLAVAHGQMSERELESVMHRFFTGEVNVLVSTSIIGAGLDIPRANTIVINRADRMGLADLYQLRGRVGRSSVKGYAYFIVPGESLMSDESKRRIQAIQEMSYLGAGFRLAMRDLEIRGAGNVFGPEQSGHIHEVGFDLYIEMLEKAVAELKGEDVREEREPVIELRVSAFIPETYIEDAMLRMGFYRRISALATEEQAGILESELRDRFGPLPQEVVDLMLVVRLRLLARSLSVLRLAERDGMVRIEFSPDTAVTPERIFGLAERFPKKVKFLPDGCELDVRKKGWPEICTMVTEALSQLSSE